MSKARMTASAGERHTDGHCCCEVSIQSESSTTTIEKSNAVRCAKGVGVAVLVQKYMIVWARNVMKLPV
jgi:hypothetical protein